MIVFFIILLEIGISSILKNVITNLETLSIILVLINTIIYIVFIILNRKISKSNKIILAFAFIIRIICLFIDRYVFYLPESDSSGDTLGYNTSALHIMENIDLIKGNVYGGIYAKILGLLYYTIGYQRLFAQSLNVFIGTYLVMIVIDIIEQLKLRTKQKNILKIITAFFPQGILFSSILHREIIIAFLATLSFKYLLLWIKDGKKSNAIICFVSLLLGSSFHVGILPLIIGYICLFSFYNRKNKKVTITTGKVIIFVILSIVIIAVCVRFRGTIMTKLEGLSLESVETIMEHSKGGSAYLKGIKINGLKSILLYSLPKMIYFLFSPMPWDFRGIADIISFLINSLVYFIVLYEIIKYMTKIENKYDRKKYMYLFIGILTCIYIMSIGTYTAGTAIRHRSKIFYCLILELALIMEYNQINRKEENI